MGLRVFIALPESNPVTEIFNLPQKFLLYLVLLHKYLGNWRIRVVILYQKKPPKICNLEMTNITKMFCLIGHFFKPILCFVHSWHQSGRKIRIPISYENFKMKIFQIKTHFFTQCISYYLHPVKH